MPITKPATATEGQQTIDRLLKLLKTKAKIGKEK
jgi:hypothetical protein